MHQPLLMSNLTATERESFLKDRPPESVELKGSSDRENDASANSGALLHLKQLD